MEREEDTKPSRARDTSGLLVGPYLLLHEIARGEQTTVHLAKKQGALGFQRLFALKRLREGFGAQPEYVSMLVDEAHLTAGLHHANLVGILDVGSEGGCYVVSDYVEGANLARLIALSAERARIDPRSGVDGAHLRFVLPLLVDALNGLAAVHGALGADNQPLEMVHQAPHAKHVLVGLDGVGRLTDFSQARAKHVNRSRERADRLRLSYMAPEQAIAPDQVDFRADLFIVGIALWEVLTGESLFGAASEEQVFQNLLHRRIPRPSETGRLPPRCFDAICMRALERDSRERFSSAAEMARELRDVALNQALYATQPEISQWVRQLLGQEPMELRNKSGEVHFPEAAPAGVGFGVHGTERPAPHTYRLPSSLAAGAEPRSFRDDEPTAPRFFVGGELELESGRPKRVKRVSTLPYGSGLEPISLEAGHLEQMRPQQAAGSSASARPAPEKNAVSGSRPGSYIQVDSSSRRERGGSESEWALPLELDLTVETAELVLDTGQLGDDVETRRYDVVPQEEASDLGTSSAQDPASSGFKPKRPSEFPRRGPAVTASQAPARIPAAAVPTTAAPTAAARRRSVQAVTEIGPTPQLSVRHDSMPGRRLLPGTEPSGTEPSGTERNGTERNGSRLQSPREGVRSVLESLPKTYEVLLAEAAERGDRPSQPQESISLAPPNLAAWTLPPGEPVRMRNWSAWIGSGVLAAVILLAAGVGARQWMLEGASSAASAREGLPAGALPEELSPAAHAAPGPVQEQPEPAAAGLKARATQAQARESEAAGAGKLTAPRAPDADALKRVRSGQRIKSSEASDAAAAVARGSEREHHSGAREHRAGAREHRAGTRGAEREHQVAAPQAPAIPENPY